MIRRSQRRVFVYVRYRESHLNVDTKDPIRLLYVNVSGESDWCFIRAKSVFLVFHQAKWTQSPRSSP